MIGIIDRFEGDIAVIETEEKKPLNLRRELLPAEAQEGDVIYLENGAYRIDSEETKRRKEEIQRLTNDLWE